MLNLSAQELNNLTSAVQRERARRQEKTLHGFSRRYWHVVEGAKLFLDNWHLGAIHEHLEACARRQIRRLIINIPPRSMKSTSTAVMYLPWMWGPFGHPEERFVYTSYSGMLSARDSRSSRHIIRSAEYQAAWGDVFQIRKTDQDSSIRFANDRTGFRLATSTGGTLTGEGGSCLATGTRVSTPRGRICIEYLRKGDVVYGYDVSRALKVECEVSAIFTTTTKCLYEVHTTKGNTFRCTADHKIYVKRRGYVRTDSLRPRDILIAEDGSEDSIIFSMRKHNNDFDVDYVHDIQVKGRHNYFAENVLVHNCLICDDPLSANDSQSDVVRESVIDWYRNVFSTRLNDPRKDIEIIVMQRLHERDLSGYVLAEVGGFEHVCLPMEWDGVTRSTKLGSYDPRSTPGELLWPERFPQTEVDLLKRKLGSYGTAGQLQQKPAPEDGGLIHISDFQLWPASSPLPIFSYVIQSLDTAFTNATANDPTGFLTLGVFEYRGRSGVMILDAWEERLEYPELRRRVQDEFLAVYGEEKGGQRNVDCVLIEEKGSGISLRQDLQRAGVPTRAYNPGKLDKKQRVHLVAPLIEAGLLWVPESTKRPKEFVSWIDWAVKQWKLFPNAQNDEAVDCLTQAMIYLHDSGWISIDAREEESELDEVRRVINPYSN